MVTKHSEVCDADGEDISPYAEKFEDADPKVNDGIFWCDECERELVLERIDKEEVFVF